MIGSPSFFTEHDVVARNYYFKLNKLGLNNVFYLVYIFSNLSNFSSRRPAGNVSGSQDCDCLIFMSALKLEYFI